MPRSPGSRASDDLAPWLAQGWSLAEAHAAYGVGLDLATARSWQTTAGLTPRQCLRWAVAEGHTSAAGRLLVARWVTCGVLDPDDRPAGVDPLTMTLCVIAQVPPDPQWASLSGQDRLLCPTLMRTAYRAKPDSGTLGDLLDALLLVAPAGSGAVCQHPLPSHGGRVSRGMLPCGWHLNQVRFGQSVLDRSAEVDWADLAACLRAGMVPGEARAFLRSGGDMGPVRLLAALT